MSLHYTSLVWDSDLTPHQKIPALFYADNADIEGCFSFKANVLIRQTGLNEDQVMETHQQLAKRGMWKED